MTMTIRKQLSLAAWGCTAVCSVLLLVAAQSAAQHGNEPQRREEPKTYTVTVPVISAPN